MAFQNEEDSQLPTDAFQCPIISCILKIISNNITNNLKLGSGNFVSGFFCRSTNWSAAKTITRDLMSYKVG